VTWLCLEVTEELRVLRPQVGLRWNRNTPPNLVERAVRTLRSKTGNPDFCSDEQIVPALTRLGVRVEDARDNFCNWDVIGLANLTDSLAALRRLVFEEQALTLPEFADRQTGRVTRSCAGRCSARSRTSATTTPKSICWQAESSSASPTSSNAGPHTAVASTFSAPPPVARTCTSSSAESPARPRTAGGPERRWQTA